METERSAGHTAHARTRNLTYLHRLEFGHVLPYLSESSLQHYPGRVEVPVQHLLATSALKGADAERDLIQRPTEAALLRRVLRRYPDHELGGAGRLVLYEASKLTPTGIGDRLCECVVPDHVPDP